jgi:uncharacterized protein
MRAWLALKLNVAAGLASVGLLAGLPVAYAQDVLPVPALTGRVIDQTGTFDTAQKAALEAKLAALEQAEGTQLVVLLVPSTQPEDVASYANRVANTWKIGRRDVGDGLLLVVAKGDRRLRIEVAKALEGAVPDLAAKRVINEFITPRFRQGDFAGGVDAGVDALIKLVNAEPLPEPAAAARASGHSQNTDGFDWQDLAIFMFIGVPIAGALLSGLLGRKLGALATGGAMGLVAFVITASLLVAGVAGVLALIFTLVSSFSGGRSGRGGPVIFPGGGGWSSGSGGGGGWSSGGGGDFGGGGASGDW